MFYLNRLLYVLILVLAGCASQPPTGGLKHYTQLPLTEKASVNFTVRRPNFVVIHHTGGGSALGALKTLTDPETQVSAHYLIGRDGTLYYLVDELARAWHSGDGYWSGVTDINSVSIGIELDNNGSEAFTPPLINTLLKLLGDLKARYKIPTANFIGHADITPGRKVDPSRYFPWNLLAQQGFGLWCEPPFPKVSADWIDRDLLFALGYEAVNLKASIGSFRLHFAQPSNALQLSEEERGLLVCLIGQKQKR